jgi:hypothetical protein
MPVYYVCRDSTITKYRGINFLYKNNVPCIDPHISQLFSSYLRNFQNEGSRIPQNVREFMYMSPAVCL